MQRNGAGGVSVEWDHDRFIINYNMDVTGTNILYLLDLLHQGLGYYCYNHITLRINSAGGEADALLHFIGELKRVRQQRLSEGRPFILETEASIMCCSAAAIMLSLGTLGYRTVRQDSKLLYHTSRSTMQGNQYTGDRLDELSRNHKILDRRILIEILRHIRPEIEQNIFNILELCYCELERDIPRFLADGARGCLGLIKMLGTKEIERLVAGLPADGPLSKDLVSEIRQKIDQRFSVLEKKYGMFTWAKIQEPPAARTPVIVGWLVGRINELLGVFLTDQTVTPEAAIRLGLIDSVAHGTSCLPRRGKTR